MSKNSKRKCCRNKRNVPTAGLKENNIDFDYDKFAEAIIKAENKINEGKIRKQKEEDDEFQKNWEKALGFKKNEQNSVLKELSQIKTVFGGIIHFKKKDIIGENAIYILFKLINSFFLGIYQFVLYFFAFIYPIIKIIILFIKNNFLNQTLNNLFNLICQNKYYILGQLILSIVLFFIARFVRIARLETEESRDKEAIMSVFNAVIAFTAMILTVITVILTAITLYMTINPSSGLIPL